MKAESTIPKEGKLPERPLRIVDPPDNLPEITQAEIVALSTALHIFRIARADFEAKRAALVMKLLRSCACEEGGYFAMLEEQDRLVIEDRTSLGVGTRRPVVDRDCVPSGGAV
jgi:hypothetical protein